MRDSILKDLTFWLLAVFAATYIIGNIATGSLTTWDEAVYANVSTEILRTGDWLIMHHEGRLWFDKPPLYIWCTALWYIMLGISEFAVRITSVLFGVATVLLTYIFVKKTFNKNTAIFSSLLLLALPHYLHFSKMGMLDVTLTFFISLMVYLFWMGQDDPRCLLFSGLTFFLAYLTKGFAAIAGPAIIFAYCVSSKNLRLLLKKEFLTGLIVSLFLISLWHIIQYVAGGQEAIRSYFGFHLFKRATTTLDGHTGGINFYQKVIFNKNKPWGVLIYASIAYLVWLIIKDKDRRAVLLLSWAVVVYTICAIVKTKLHWYIMPISPALAIASGIFLERIFKNRAFRAALAVILLGMLIQVPVSWAFKLDFNAKAKDAALHSIKLPYEDDGTIFYNTVAKIRNK